MMIKLITGRKYWLPRFALLGLDPEEYLKALLVKVEAYNNNDTEIQKIKNPVRKIHPGTGLRIS